MSVTQEQLESFFTDLPDSGERREFGTGAVRDMATKGRCDLLPWDTLADQLFLEGTPAWYFCHSMAKATHHEDLVCHVSAMFQYFITQAFDGCVFTGCLSVAFHYEAGSKKYSARNWENGIPIDVYLDSAGRHFLKYNRGDDDEPHDRAVIWNLLGALWTIENCPEMIEAPYGM